MTTYAYVNPVVAVALGWALLAEPITAQAGRWGAGRRGRRDRHLDRAPPPKGRRGQGQASLVSGRARVRRERRPQCGKPAATASKRSLASGSPIVHRTPSPANGRTTTPAAAQAAANSPVRSPSRSQTKFALRRPAPRQPWSAQRACDHALALRDERVDPLEQLGLGRERGDGGRLGDAETPKGSGGLAQRLGDRRRARPRSRPAGRPGRTPWRTSAARPRSVPARRARAPSGDLRRRGRTRR